MREYDFRPWQLQKFSYARQVLCARFFICMCTFIWETRSTLRNRGLPCHQFPVMGTVLKQVTVLFIEEVEDLPLLVKSKPRQEKYELRDSHVPLRVQLRR
jgi:hypothetical protein